METDDRWGGQIERLAADWLLPESLIAAAVPPPYPEALRPEEAALWQRARPQAESLAAWRLAYLADEAADCADTAGDCAARRARQLGWLYRAIYCDAPDYQHVLMHLVTRHAQLFGPAADATLAREMRDVYAPVAAMLGLYRFRRQWIEESQRILDPAGYRQMAGEMGIQLDSPTTAGLFETLWSQQAAWIDQARQEPHPPYDQMVARLPSAGKPVPTLDECRAIYELLCSQIVAALAEAFAPDAPPRLDLLPMLPGLIQYESKRLRSADEPPPQLSVRVLCPDTTACYRALGVIHNLARSTAIERAGRLRDYISAPLPNGYRALQTVCLWSPAPEAPRRLIKFHILTRDMNEVNEWGILTDGRFPLSLSALLNQINKLSDMLAKRTGNAQTDIVDFLQHHKPGSPSDLIYCFTPRGQIHLLKQGSLPLDFAYAIHSQLGHQSVYIDVNGEHASLDKPLGNGDLVYVKRDPTITRLDFSWLYLVQTGKGRQQVRLGLRQRAAYVHPGCGAFVSALIDLIDTYGRDTIRQRKSKAYRPPIPTDREIEDFLWRMARRRDLPDLESLYEQIAADPSLARNLAHRLISQYILPQLDITASQRTMQSLGRLELCPACRPTPVDRLQFTTHLHPEAETLTVHTDYCRNAAGGAVAPVTRRARQLQQDRWPMYRYAINTPDYRGLLKTLLDKVAQLPNSYLFRVEANANGEGWAVVEMDVAVQQPQLAQDLRHLIEGMSEQTHAPFKPLHMDPRSGRLAAALNQEIINPFTEGEVTDWRFIDRQEALGALLNWIDEPASPVLLLHGQRRVGKSSLARRLIDCELPSDRERPVVPVFVDFRSPSVLRPETVADLIGREVSLQVGLRSTPRATHDDPMVWLSDLLGQTLARLGDARLLIVIDEFDADLTAGTRHATQPPVLLNLRAIMATRPQILWLLIVQDVFLADPAYRVALPDVPHNAPRLAVTHLSGPYARQLIEKLTAQQQYTFQSASADRDDIPAQIVSWTAGNPYLIHVICRKLLERAIRERRREITQVDLNRTVNQVLDRHSYLGHFTHHLAGHPLRRTMATFVARHTRPGLRLSLPDLLTGLHLVNEPAARADVTAQAEFMTHVGVFDLVRHVDGEESVAIPMRLLHQWIKNNWASDYCEEESSASEWGRLEKGEAAIARGAR